MAVAISGIKQDEGDAGGSAERKRGGTHDREAWGLSGKEVGWGPGNESNLAWADNIYDNSRTRGIRLAREYSFQNE